MRSLITFGVVLCALIVGSLSWTSNASSGMRKQRAVTTFEKPVTLQGVVLSGEYLFVHDDAAMGRGEACTYVYKGKAEIADKLVASFHCMPVERAKADHFTVRSAQTPRGTELREFQFAGDKESHAIPTKVLEAHINLTN